MMFKLSVALLALSSATCTLAAKLDLVYSTPYPYAAHRPTSGASKLPVFLFLHGSGSSANPDKLGQNTLWDGAGYLINRFDNGQTSGAPGLLGKNFLTILPLHEPTYGNTREWVPSKVMAVLNDVKSRYSVDDDQILIGGYSMGSKGAWLTAIANPSVFAAGIFTAGFNEFSSSQNVLSTDDLQKLKNNNFGIRAFVGTADDKQPPSVATPVFAKLSSIGANNADLVQVPGADHGKMSSEPWLREDLWNWALSQKNSRSGSSPATTAPTTVEEPVKTTTTTTTEEKEASTTIRASAAENPQLHVVTTTAPAAAAPTSRGGKKRCSKKRRMRRHFVDGARRV